MSPATFEPTAHLSGTDSQAILEGKGADLSLHGGRSDLIAKLKESSKIMIIDDEPAVIGVVSELLKADGYKNILSSSDSRDGIALITAKRPDVVLLDIQMPGVSGLEILDLVRRNPTMADMPVIVLTAATEFDVKMQALDRGAVDFLNKPLHAGELLVRLRNVLTAIAREKRLRLLERQKRMMAERELQAAERIQAQLFPERPPQLPGFDIAGAALSAGAGCGDYFDFLNLTNERVGLVVGDVSGHGMPSALRMVETRAYLRSLARHHIELGYMFTKLNQFMLKEAAYETGEAADQFVTLFLAAIDVKKRQLFYASGGHAAYIMRESGETRKLESTGLPLGLFDQPLETAGPIELNVGDLLLIATDGIEEAMTHDGERFGIARVLADLRASRGLSAQEIIQRLFSSARGFTQGHAQHDDMTAIVAKVLAVPQRGDKSPS